MTSPRVLVTGAGGFIGTFAVRILASRGIEVHAFSRREVGIEGARVRRLDLLESGDAVDEALRQIRPTHLLHLAWIATPGVYWVSLENYRWVGATIHLATSFLKHGGSRMTVAGSGMEYGDTGGVDAEESRSTAPDSPYSISKDATRRILLSLGNEAGISVSWARVFSLYGPGEPEARLVPSVVRSLLAGREARCTDGLHVRDFLHVRDVAAGLVELLLSDVTGAVNISSGSGIRVRDVAETIARLTGSAELLKLGVLPSRSEPQRLVGVNTRLRTEVGWSPSFSLESGLADTISWFRSNV